MRSRSSLKRVSNSGGGLALRAQGVRVSQIEERILEGRPARERNGWLAGELGDGDAGIGARGHGYGESAVTDPGF